MNLITNNAVTMSSQEIAEMVGKRHDNVKRTIESLAAGHVIELPQIEVIPTATKPVNVYVFSGAKGKRDSLVVVAQLSPEFTGALVDRWQHLEQQNQAPALPGDYISALEHLLESKRSERLAIEQRDQAIATKAQIGAKREATAMATASAAVREAARLRDELGFSARHATILKVETALNRRFSFVNLRRWCKANGVTPETVPDKRYGEGVKAWPAAAWAAVFDIDLADLFGADGEQA
ncbi:Rha family transcriptional regulator [Pseudomonas jessenii]|uniref:Regulatory protein Rha n=1 Tax=Pseudomonas jessenii TaxID=77298 RepID=A0A370SWM1_PSEJE|nr:Rha family transcriptional regulator [Pseudomonas jessenii]RDL24146.1 regulatory protein Rha [Pseudomonas jessenii]